MLGFLYTDVTYDKEVFRLLVLGRKPGEYVLIGNDIKVEVVRSSEGDLRLAINAPSNVKILRGELHKQSPPGTSGSFGEEPDLILTKYLEIIY